MRAVEIACDESGFSGTNLLDPRTPVITHAAVDLPAAEAAEVLGRVRANSRHLQSEYKSTQLLRQRSAVECLLESLAGAASVQLIDKRFFVVYRMVDFLLGEPTYAAGTSLAPGLREAAAELHREAPTIFGSANWYAVLTSFVVMMRTKRHRVVNRPAVDNFFDALGRLDGDLELVGRLRGSRGRVRGVLTTLLDDRSSVPPPLEPLLIGLVETTLHWSRGERAVDIVHDEQSALTPHRVDSIRALLSGSLGSFRQVDSREHPRVQVADLLAGVARHLATEELHGCADAGLTALLQPYVLRSSLWADEASGRRLALPAEV
ncbi:hypothetical protein EV138_4846 [Kribbella voronezhensis]|uniref:DUF3800 domain-containing protein n=1 Tax=Kribbella voronezhensis TaxID=2512212 RepID=A0A4R7TGB6_9ACTN|nr:DUF3800 domain-containing protein [Kribbella voronezhensis]TDU91244.1 hypothetical protein EV138_4846 [Kribbella voronezhensis]